MFAAVITTIQKPTPAVVKLVQKLADCGGLLVVAGDKKGPAHFRSRHFAEGCRIEFLSLTDLPSAELELIELWLENFGLAATNNPTCAKNTSVIESFGAT